jgi:hypothetical protein
VHVLSPRDFGLARGWFESGVPLATVLVGIDRGFDAGESVTSLAFCQQRIDELAATGRLPTARPGPPAESVPLADVGFLLATLAERLSDLRPGPGACFEAPMRRIQEARDLLAVAARPNWGYLRERLRDIDDDVSAAVLQALSDADRAAYREEAHRAIDRQRGRVADGAIEDAIARFMMQRAREALGLPRVSLV